MLGIIPVIIAGIITFTITLVMAAINAATIAFFAVTDEAVLKCLT